ncbi:MULTISPECIES: hypothetical protein [Vibrio]|uniref:hypothetical protein n=1 Tax=Vibrio TaxID=662 RepID=UPI0002DD0390|nr:hypothetical protein [Vibrio tasmaniensis]OEF86224.1 hypothetical protein A162_00945 [Vibrio tasmaniensis 1F-155]PMO76001.1 hypothetical protein BCT01_16790 [Vibrio tasmaniensis]
MSLDKLLHKVKHIYLTGNLSEQVLAAQILSRFQNTKYLIIERLESQNPDLVLTSLECLALDNAAPIEPILNCYQYWDDSEIKLASLMAIENNQHSVLAVPVLLEAVCDENDYWDGGWNDGDDISLIAARILDNHKHQLDHEQSLRLLHRLQNDPEPDLKGKLIALLSCHSPTLLNENNVLKSTADTRIFLRNTQDKVVLYKATQHPDISCQKVAFQRLSEMDCREYLQVFLNGLSHSDPSIRESSVHQLTKWNYLVDIKHLNFELLLSGMLLNSLIGLMSNKDKLHVIDQLQNKPNLANATAAAILLISNLETQHKQLQLARFIPHFYQVFSKLEESEQLDSLNSLLTETSEQFSVAFIRQQLQQEACSNSIKRLLIEHLSKNPKTSHQSYLKELTLGTSGIIVADSSLKPRTTTSIAPIDEMNNTVINGTNEQSALVTSTLDSLMQTHSPAVSTAPSSLTSVKKRSNRSAKIEALENQAIALEFCSNKTWLCGLCSDDKISYLTKAAFYALIHALCRHSISFSDVQSSRFNQLTLELLLDEQSENIGDILDWLGDDWIQQNRLSLMSSPCLSLRVGLIKHINDEQQLLELIKHSYIGIQHAALNQLALNGVCPQKKLIGLLLEEPLLYPQLANFEAHTVYEILESELDHRSSTTLQATLTYLETTSNHP